LLLGNRTSTCAALSVFGKEVEVVNCASITSSK
jgi:hypothetical protein